MNYLHFSWVPGGSSDAAKQRVTVTQIDVDGSVVREASRDINASSNQLTTTDFDPNFPLIEGQTIRVKVETIDEAGNIGVAPLVGEFAIPIEPPADATDLVFELH